MVTFDHTTHIEKQIVEPVVASLIISVMLKAHYKFIWL